MDDQSSQKPASTNSSPNPADQISQILPPADAEEQEVLKEVESLKNDEEVEGRKDAEVIEKREQEHIEEEKEEKKITTPTTQSS